MSVHAAEAASPAESGGLPHPQVGPRRHRDPERLACGRLVIRSEQKSIAADGSSAGK